VGLDGDDTLGHNETRFQLTQTALRDFLRRHVPDADVDRHLAEVEMRNLRLYGYCKAMHMPRPDQRADNDFRNALVRIMDEPPDATG
jgi:hypothetical protein